MNSNPNKYPNQRFHSSSYSLRSGAMDETNS
ncbi:hypothetical protein FHS09_001519 [Microbulbifer rhizosphaerae]|uniref:Uncharacterized protein n=1 Tax=Microbulbifer rhizosphaerae TaxID=1562603 RepID=A0A7W4WAX5_9GAMM|nr:hypothetical protein [Microbulbifer rhizosphaerae]